MAVFDFSSVVGGIPIKTTQATKDTMDGKAFRIGYQTATLAAERQKLEEEKMLLQQERAAIMQQLLSASAQMSAMQGAQAGAMAGMSTGLGMAGQPIGPNGEIPPMPMGAPPGPSPDMGGPMPPMM